MLFRSDVLLNSQRNVLSDPFENGNLKYSPAEDNLGLVATMKKALGI